MVCARTTRPAPPAPFGSSPPAPVHATTTAIVTQVLERPAIAVLPFVPKGGNDQAYLADGLTDEVIGALCAWRSFPVISRNTSFLYRDVGRLPLRLSSVFASIANGYDKASGTIADANVPMRSASGPKERVPTVGLSAF